MNSIASMFHQADSLSSVMNNERQQASNDVNIIEDDREITGDDHHEAPSRLTSSREMVLDFTHTKKGSASQDEGDQSFESLTDQIFWEEEGRQLTNNYSSQQANNNEAENMIAASNVSLRSLQLMQPKENKTDINPVRLPQGVSPKDPSLRQPKLEGMLDMEEALKAMRDEDSNAWVLTLTSYPFRICHATRAFHRIAGRSVVGECFFETFRQAEAMPLPPSCGTTSSPPLGMSKVLIHGLVSCRIYVRAVFEDFKAPNQNLLYYGVMVPLQHVQKQTPTKKRYEAGLKVAPQY